jgi:AraC-like DNA-binding protein
MSKNNFRSFFREISVPFEKVSAIRHVIIAGESFSKEGISQKFLPNPGIALVFHYGDKVLWSKDNINFIELPNQYVATPFMADFPIFFKLGKTIRTAIFIFEPSAFFHLKKKYSNCIPSIFTDSEKCLGKELSEKLKLAFYQESGTRKSISNVLEVFEKEQIDNSKVFNKIQESLEWIYKFHGTASIKTIADKCKISTRTLERYYSAHIGKSPGAYSRIVRFFSLLHALSNNSKISKLDFIEKYNFTDYSHLHKEFRTFSDETPNQYLRNLDSSYYFEKQFMKATMSGIYKD